MSDLPPPFPEIDVPPPYEQSPNPPMLPDIITEQYVPPPFVPERPPAAYPAQPQSSTSGLAIIACFVLPFGLIPGIGLAAAVLAYALGSAALSSIATNPNLGGASAAHIAKSGSYGIGVLQAVFAIPLIIWLYYVNQEIEAAHQIGEQVVGVGRDAVGLGQQILDLLRELTQ